MKSLKELYKIGAGPSSSHTMGPQKAAEHYISKFPEADSFEVVLYGSLALTGKGHLTDWIIIETFKPKPVNIIWKMTESLPEHPNAMSIKGFQNGEELELIKYFSVGGGAIKINSLDGDTTNDIYPERNWKQVKQWCRENNKTLVEYVYEHEDDDFHEYMEKIIDTMINCVDEGLEKEGLLPGTLELHRRAKHIIDQNAYDGYERAQKISAYAFAAAEQNASGGTIVTAPTCGASGVIPAIIYFAIKDLKHEKEVILDALIAAGIIGNIVKTNATISGAEGGCQAEIGTATSMAAAMIGYARGYDLEKVGHAAESGLEHFLGLTCDPVEGYVQIPCIERNAIAANTAMQAANIAGYGSDDWKIDFDTIVTTMLETGKDLPEGYRETSLSGLAKHYFNK